MPYLFLKLENILARSQVTATKTCAESVESTHTHTTHHTYTTHTHTHHTHTHHTHTHTPHTTHTRLDSPEPMISSSHRPLPTRHTTGARNEHPCCQRESNPRPQQSSGHRLTPYSARPSGSPVSVGIHEVDVMTDRSIN